VLALLFVVFLVIIRIETPNLRGKSYRKDLIVFLSFLLTAFVLSALLVLDVAIPSPEKGIKYLINDVLDLAYESQ